MRRQLRFLNFSVISLCFFMFGVTSGSVTFQRSILVTCVGTKYSEPRADSYKADAIIHGSAAGAGAFFDVAEVR